MKKLLPYILILVNLSAFGQGSDIIINVKGYKAVSDASFKKWQDSNANAAKAAALKIVQDNISKATADAKAAAAKSFTESMDKFSLVETVRETLKPDSITGKVYLLSAKPINAYVDRVIGISEAMNMELIEGVDYTITKTTGKITLIGKGIPLFARKNLFAVYQKISP